MQWKQCALQTSNKRSSKDRINGKRNASGTQKCNEYRNIPKLEDSVSKKLQSLLSHIGYGSLFTYLGYEIKGIKKLQIGNRTYWAGGAITAVYTT